MASPQLEQVTVRASVQSGKTASLIVAALYHLARGRSVLFYEPQEVLMRAMGRRITAWGRGARDEALNACFKDNRQHLVREHESGGVWRS